MAGPADDPCAANGWRRKSTRIPRKRTCSAGCLGCSVSRKGHFAKCEKEIKSGNFSDDEICRKERLLEDIYKNGPAIAATKQEKKEEVEEEEEEEEEALEPSPFDDLVCTICGKGECDPEMLICDGCDRGFHMYCLCPILIKVPKGTWFCPLCSKKEKVTDFPLVQTQIIDFFHIQKPLANNSVLELKLEARRRRRHSICIYKKRRRFLPHTPSKDHTRRLQQMASLATALSSTNVEFRDELTYPPGLAPEWANRACFERGGMQVISKEDLITLNLCKMMCARGEWPPLMVTHDPREGFVVEADAFIKDLTLIAEYTGDVDYMRNRLHDDSDNLMGLLFPEDPSKELVICPDKRGNIARFISGINNHTLEGRRKQNLRCVRYDINGQVRVLLVAIRDIAKDI